MASSSKTESDTVQMKYHFSILALSMLLAGCGDRNVQGIQDAVRQKLKDPSSAKFEEVVISKAGDRACIRWNAKNSFGGYGNWEVAELWKDGENWKIMSLEGSSSNCTEQAFQMADSMGELGLKELMAARDKAINHLLANGKFTQEDVNKLNQAQELSEEKRRCGYVIKDIEMAALSLAEAKVKKEPTTYADQKLKDNFAKLDADFCM